MTVYSSGGNPLTSLVNLNQTADERRYKYSEARKQGFTYHDCRKFRDMRYTALKRIFGLDIKPFCDYQANDDRY